MPSGMIMRYIFQLECSFFLLSDLRISKISIPVFYRRAPSLLSQTCHTVSHEFFCHPPLLHLNVSPIGSFSFGRFFLFRIAPNAISVLSLAITESITLFSIFHDVFGQVPIMSPLCHL